MRVVAVAGAAPAPLVGADASSGLTVANTGIMPAIRCAARGVVGTLLTVSAPAVGYDRRHRDPIPRCPPARPRRRGGT